MQDQAQRLKKLGEEELTVVVPNMEKHFPHQKTIAITSGKGGVGKSNIAVNLAISLTRFGHRVLIFDADFGLANIDLLLGLTPRYNLQHVFSGKKELEEIILTGPSGIRILPSSTGGKRLEDMTPEMKREILNHLKRMPEKADIIFIDTGAGISDNVIDFLVLSDEILLVTTPEPTSIMDSYGVLKLLAQKRAHTLIRLLVNMAENSYDAQHVIRTVKMISRQFFNINIEEMGWVFYDHLVSRSVRQQQPFVLLYPTSRASRSMNQVATKFANYDVDFISDRGVWGFLRRAVSFLS